MRTLLLLVVAGLLGCVEDVTQEYRGTADDCRSSSDGVPGVDVILIVHRRTGVPTEGLFGYGTRDFVDTWVVAEVDRISEDDDGMDVRGSFKTDGTPDSFDLELTAVDDGMEGSLEVVDASTLFTCADVNLTPAD